MRCSFSANAVFDRLKKGKHHCSRKTLESYTRFSHQVLRSLRHPHKRQIARAICDCFFFYITLSFYQEFTLEKSDVYCSSRAAASSVKKMDIYILSLWRVKGVVYIRYLPTTAILEKLNIEPYLSAAPRQETSIPPIPSRTHDPSYGHMEQQNVAYHQPPAQQLVRRTNSIACLS